MRLVSLLFSVRGRINRTQYWAASFGVNVGVWLAFVLVLMLAIGLTPKGAGKEGALGALIMLFLAALPILGVAYWCQFAITVKRFHDRGRSWYFALAPLVLIAPAFMIGFGASLKWEAANALLQPYMLVAMAVCLWLFVDLGCLPGVDGPNRFGDPPGGGGNWRPIEPAPQPRAPASATASIFGAQAAMDRAIAERATHVQRKPAPAAAQAPRAPMPAAARPAAAPSFGRRAPT